MNEVVMYTKAGCPFCDRAEKLLVDRGAKNIHFRRIDLNPDYRQQLIDAGKRTVPQISIGGIEIGGFTELVTLDASGKLKTMLQGPMVEIPKAEYQSLLEDSRFLQHLQNNGVDNWSGYSHPDSEEEDDA